MLRLTKLTPGVRTLLLITVLACVGSWFARAATGFDVLPLVVFSGDMFVHGALWQVLTYPWFYPAGAVLGWFLDLLMLWMFGIAVEEEIGTRRLYKLFVASAVLGALASAVSALAGLPNQVLIGIKVPLFAVMMAFCILQAEAIMTFMFVMVMPGKYLGAVLLALACACYPSWIPSFLAALGTAYVIVTRPKLSWLRSRPRQSRLSSLPLGSKVTPLRSRTESPASALELEVDRILSKLSREGMASLTPQEKQTLDQQSLRLRDQGSV